MRRQDQNRRPTLQSLSGRPIDGSRTKSVRCGKSPTADVDDLDTGISSGKAARAAGRV
jgi:hypothetical protein